MFKKSDPYSFKSFNPLLSGSATIGSIYAQYQVSHFDDVLLKDAGSIEKKRCRQYLLQATQRINIYNQNGMDISPNKNLNSYDNYPVLINAMISLDSATAGVDFELLDYSPQTVNTKVQSSGTSGSSTGQTQGSSSSSTVGSSTSQTNSFGASVTIGDISGIGESYEHSSTVTHEHSHTTGSESSNSKSSDSSSSASMSIKDWGAYALVNPANKMPSWTFGQEFPWDAINCRKTDGATNPTSNNQVHIILPSEMSVRLYDGVSLYPPSQLSMFGINFIMKAQWLVTINDGESDEVEIKPNIFYFSGSHVLTKSGDAAEVSVYMDQKPSILNSQQSGSLDSTIDLALLAMDPLGLPNKTAIVGFIPGKFTTKPVLSSDSAPPVAFKINSSSNNFLIKDTTNYPAKCDAGTGFKTSETALDACFSKSCSALQFTAFFKVVDSVHNYTLCLKHWKTGTTGVALKLCINKDTDCTITKYVDTYEAEGGESNLTTIELRNQSYSSIDYHDYLQMGLNSIELTIEPIGGNWTSDCGYQLRAMSIERD